ncbi:MAG: lipoyl(octanoyl) transferase LipB [Methyloceanibacter sp.]|uniref:lipoyl(octanoyl) transferase LipB n=1 Tax=Methyloceanibacter sp. TaxID=1965321 RepID=UPI003D9B9C8C
MLNNGRKPPVPLPRLSEVDWRVDIEAIPYEAALQAMQAHVEAMTVGRAPERVWLLGHPSLYTGGTSADPAELLDPHRFPVYRSGRGGRFTYHGPGQRVAYVMLDLNKRGRDVRAFVSSLQDWLIAALAQLGVAGERHDDQIGVFVDDAKIASVGIRVRRWVTFHGVSLNVDPDLEHFSGIVPCGLNTPVTSLAALGGTTETDQVDAALRAAFDEVFARDDS